MTLEGYKLILVSCLNLLNFITSCPGGTSWLETPDGERLGCDWGYVEDGLRELKKWSGNKVADELRKLPIAWPPEGSSSIKVYPDDPEWTEDNKCSRCGASACAGYDEEPWLTRYCPHCGVKMKNPEEYE